MSDIVLERNVVNVGSEQITGMSTLKTLSPPAGATHAELDVEGAVVRWTDDPTASNPTATTGRRWLADSGPIPYSTLPMQNLRMIEEAASAIVNVTYYRARATKDAA